MARDANLESIIFQYLEYPLNQCGYASNRIYFGYENAPQPEGSYAILLIQNYNDEPVELRNKYEDNSAKEIEEHLYFRSVITVSVDLFGVDCLYNASLIKALLQSSDVIEKANSLKIGYNAVTDTTNLGYVYKGGYLPRCSFNLLLNHTHKFVYKIGTIGQVRVYGKNADTGDVIADTTVQEPNFGEANT